MKKLLYFSVLLLLLTGSSVVRADNDHLRAKDLVESGEILPLEKLIQSIFEGRQWRLLEAELEEEQGRYIYELEILDDRGKVREIKYDAKTGEAIKGDDK